jgi:peptidoglycan/xylan/chitin deacetylase (PgdA/CDA1 family)
VRLKELFLRVAQRCGLFEIVANSRWRQRRLLVLCYHGVAMRDEREWWPEMYFSQQEFRERLQLLRDGGYKVLPLSEAAPRLYAGTLPPKCVALTFDDGCVDFEERALPVLREFNAPATLYLTTYYCGKNYPVFFTALNYVLWTGRQTKLSPDELLDLGGPFSVSTDADRQVMWQQLCNYVRAQQLDSRQRNALIARVATALNVDYAEILDQRLMQVMSEETVRNLPTDLVDVQLHTHRHKAPNNHEEFLRELADNTRVVIALRGTENPLEHFCYPSNEYYGELIDWLHQHGVRYAVTCLPGLASTKSHPMLMPRYVDTALQSRTAFLAWASGFQQFIPRRSRHLVDAARVKSRHLRPAPSKASAKDAPASVFNAR